jgi:eukaryotic-like serine/threonine-protein kinase
MFTGQTFGRYEIRSKLGAGGMGEVYAARDTQLGREVALKILSAEFSADEIRKSRFHREARAASALNHPNIMTIYEIGENEHGTFMVTELIDGKTLREVIKSRSLSILQALKIAEQIASALSAAHHAHIVHRDIKPENVMIRHDGYVKVLDFGLAKSIPQGLSDPLEENSVTKTTPGIIIGSVRYMSPEQARGQAVDERTDIWSLGVVLYEMLAGRAPFDGETTSDTLGAVIFKEPEEILRLTPNPPPEVKSIIARSLEKDRDRRYQKVADFALDIKNLIYKIEHEISLESRGPIMAPNPDINENPTLIHQTVSANHPTHVSTAPTTVSTELQSGESGRRRRRPLVPIAVAASVILAILIGGLLLYRWSGKGKTSMASNFERTKISRLNSDGKVRVPAISPDGKYLAYASGETGNRSLVVRQLATDSEVTVVPPTALNFATIAFSPSGDYVFYTQTSSNYGLNTLYQVPTLGGTQKKLIEDVDSAPTFSPDGKRMAFIRHSSKEAEDIVFTANADGSNIARLISRKQTEFDFFSTPAWSPSGDEILIGAGKSQGGVASGSVILEVSATDGKFKIFSPKKWVVIDSLVWLKDASGLLLIAKESSTTPLQIWRIAYPSGVEQAVTNDLNNYIGLGVSADGKTLITVKSDSVSSLWNFTPQAREAVQLTSESPNLEGAAGITQAPDGKLLYTMSEGNEINIWMLDADGKNPRRLTSEKRLNQNPLVTPDGRYVVFNSTRSGTWRIWRMDIDGNNPIQLTEESAEGFDSNLFITPDGKSVLFNRNYIGDEHPSELMSVTIEGGPAAPMLSDPKHSNFLQRVSPDGEHLAFVSFDIATFEKKLIIAAFHNNSVGEVEKSLPYSLISAFSWSPDGKSFTYLSGEGIPNLWRLSLDGAKPQPITDFKSGRIFNFTWSRDGKSLFIVRGIVNNDLVLIQDAGSTPAS